MAKIIWMGDSSISGSVFDMHSFCLSLKAVHKCGFMRFSFITEFRFQTRKKNNLCINVCNVSAVNENNFTLNIFFFFFEFVIYWSVAYLLFT